MIDDCFQLRRFCSKSDMLDIVIDNMNSRTISLQPRKIDARAILGNEIFFSNFFLLSLGISTLTI
jgi:hypothetical protein